MKTNMNNKIQQALLNIESRLDTINIVKEDVGNCALDITEYLVEIVIILANQNEELAEEIKNLTEVTIRLTQREQELTNQVNELITEIKDLDERINQLEIR
jgi:pyruvate kinase